MNKILGFGLLCVAVFASSSLDAFGGWLPGRTGGLGGSSTTITPTSGRIDGQLTFDDLTITNKTGDFIGFAPTSWGVGSNLIKEVGIVAVGDAYTFTDATVGTFVGTITNVAAPTGDPTADGGLTSSSRVFNLTGTFTGGSSSFFDGAGGRDPLLATMTLTFTRNSSPGTGTVAFSWSMDTFGVPAAVPEPTSIAIFGLGAVGFAVRRFRRK